MAYDTPDINLGDEPYLQAKEHTFRPLAESLVIGICMFAAVMVTTLFLYFHSMRALKIEIQNGLLRTAITLSQFVDGDLHETLLDPSRQDSAAYEEAVDPLARAVAADSTMAYAYTLVLREGGVYFVLDPTPAGDADGDGVDDKSYIMEAYPDPSPVMLEALKTGKPVVEQEVYSDKWGTFLSGYAPVHDSDGKVVAILGIDITADDYVERLKPIRQATIRSVVTGLFMAFIVGSLIWFVRNFTREINRKRLEALRHMERLMETGGTHNAD